MVSNTLHLHVRQNLELMNFSFFFPQVNKCHEAICLCQQGLAEWCETLHPYIPIIEIHYRRTSSYCEWFPGSKSMVPKSAVHKVRECGEHVPRLTGDTGRHIILETNWFILEMYMQSSRLLVWSCSQVPKYCRQRCIKCFVPGNAFSWVMWNFTF